MIAEPDAERIGPRPIVITDAMLAWARAMMEALRNPAYIPFSDTVKVFAASADALQAVPLTPDEQAAVRYLLAQNRGAELGIEFGNPEAEEKHDGR